MFGSASFTLFHLFRMAVVMSLTGLALAVATPLTPTQAVLLMGMLSIIYCTLGGIEAVIWTDTIQTFVLLGGALLALYVLVQGTAGGAEGLFASASQADKLRLANLFWDPFSTQAALWVIVIGGIGQNVASYTADQAVVQRYMTTPSEKLASAGHLDECPADDPRNIPVFRHWHSVIRVLSVASRQAGSHHHHGSDFPAVYRQRNAPGNCGIDCGGTVFRRPVHCFHQHEFDGNNNRDRLSPPLWRLSR